MRRREANVGGAQRTSFALPRRPSPATPEQSNARLVWTQERSGSDARLLRAATGPTLQETSDGLRQSPRAVPATASRRPDPEEAMSEANVSAEQPPSGAPSRVPSPNGHPSRPGDRQSAAQERATPSVGLIWQVRDRASFGALRSAGRRVRRGPITLTWLPSDSGVPPRVAYAVSRKVGSAVVRNRIRRRLRAVISDLGAELRPGTYLIGARREVASVPYERLRSVMHEALDGAFRRRAGT